MVQSEFVKEDTMLKVQCTLKFFRKIFRVSPESKISLFCMYIHIQYMYKYCGRPHQTVGVNLRFQVNSDDSKFGFVQGRGTTDAIFVVRQLQEKYLAANKRLYMAFVDLGKAFDQVPRKVIWLVLRKLGVEEWIVRLVQGMYAYARSRVPVFAKTAGLSDKTGKFSFCPAENFSLSDKCPVILVKKRL